LAHQAATAGLLAPLLIVLVNAMLAPWKQEEAAHREVTLIVSGICLLLLVAGIACAIIALCGIPRFGRARLLGKGVAGLIINGLLVAIFISNFIVSFNKSLKSRQAQREMNTAVSELHSNVQKSFDPKSGITNVDLSGFQNQLKDASEKMPGEDALLVQATSAHVARIQNALKHYQVAAGKLRETEVLNNLNLTDKEQITSRREVVESFLARNTEFASIITNAEKNILADLARLQVSSAKTEQFMAGYRSKARLVDPLIIQIRQCDDQMGKAMLGVLDLLEADWGKWNYDSTASQTHFEKAASRESYRNFILAIQTAGSDQLRLQKKLISLQSQ
jgi:hypothetical protein